MRESQRGVQFQHPSQEHWQWLCAMMQQQPHQLYTPCATLPMWTPEAPPSSLYTLAAKSVSSRYVWLLLHRDIVLGAAYSHAIQWRMRFASCGLWFFSRPPARRTTSQNPTLIGFTQYDHKPVPSPFSFDSCEDSEQTLAALQQDSWQMLCDVTFAHLRLHRLETALGHNSRWRPVLEMLGFVHEGTLRRDRFVQGQLCDTDVFGLLAPDYQPLTDTEGSLP